MLTFPVVIVTFTGAWSHVPVAAGSASSTSTVMVGGLVLPPPPWLGGGVMATVPTDEITPGMVVLPSGRVMVTWSPAFTCDC